MTSIPAMVQRALQNDLKPSIGLTTRLRELAVAGWKPFWAFSSGVAVNVVLGFVLSVLVFYSYWSHL